MSREYAELKSYDWNQILTGDATEDTLKKFIKDILHTEACPSNTCEEVENGITPVDEKATRRSMSRRNMAWKKYRGMN